MPRRASTGAREPRHLDARLGFPRSWGLASTPTWAPEEAFSLAPQCPWLEEVQPIFGKFARFQIDREILDRLVM